MLQSSKLFPISLGARYGVQVQNVSCGLMFFYRQKKFYLWASIRAEPGCIAPATSPLLPVLRVFDLGKQLNLVMQFYLPTWKIRLQKLMCTVIGLRAPRIVAQRWMPPCCERPADCSGLRNKPRPILRHQMTSFVKVTISSTQQLSS